MSNYSSLFESFLQDPNLLEQTALTDLEIDRDLPLDDYLHTQASHYFKWGALAAIAEGRAARQKYRVKEELWPIARTNARTYLKTAGEKITEGAVDDKAMLDAVYRKGLELLNDLEVVANTLRSAERAMAQRVDMLRSVNSRQRSELEGQFSSDMDRVRTVIKKNKH